MNGGYVAEVDSLDRSQWYRALEEFEDANIYQTWAYVAVTSGHSNMSHLVLKKDGEIVALALLRIAKLPLLKAGIAYLRWGPVWRRRGLNLDPEIFRNALRAVRNEYAQRRGLAIRIFPLIFDSDSPDFVSVLRDEGFSTIKSEAQPRTILMDLGPPLDRLRDGMTSHWKRELKLAERKELQVAEGTDLATFDTFIRIYREMVSRKQFPEPNDINQFRAIQEQLPANCKMKVMLCNSNSDVCAGLICSAIGNMAVYLFGATSNAGMKSNGSYFLQWRLLDELRRAGVTIYNLHGINPDKNPGTYKFKSDLAGANGRDVRFLGRFDCQASFLSRACVRFAEATKILKRIVRGNRLPTRTESPSPKPISSARGIRASLGSR